MASAPGRWTFYSKARKISSLVRVLLKNMGRNTPKSTKHKKLKAIDPFYKGDRKDILDRHAEKCNAKPENPDVQEVPRKLKEIMHSQQLIKEGKLAKIRRLNDRSNPALAEDFGNNVKGCERHGQKMPVFEKRRGETDAQLLRRVEAYSMNVIAETKLESKFGVIITEDEHGNVEVEKSNIDIDLELKKMTGAKKLVSDGKKLKRKKLEAKRKEKKLFKKTKRVGDFDHLKGIGESSGSSLQFLPVSISLETNASNSGKNELKRKSITISTKIDIIKEVEAKVKRKKDIAREYGIPLSSLSTILKNKEKLQKAYDSGSVTDKRMKLRTSVYEDVEKSLLTWVQEKRAQNEKIPGIVLEEKANGFAAMLGHDGFKASTGWIGRFKERHGFSSVRSFGESSSAEDLDIQSWKDRFQEKDVFCQGETGVFYKLLPNGTLAVKGEKCQGGEGSHERVTVSLCCNMDGSEKCKLFVIGKVQRPRCYVNVRSISVDYSGNRSAWMTRELFEAWLKRFDDNMHDQNRKVLLFVSNVLSHYTSSKLRATELLYLPRDAMTCAYPLDQGVIRSFKSHFRRRLVHHVITDIDKQHETKIDLRTACDMMHGAWLSVTPNVVQNCFQKSGLCKSLCIIEEVPDDTETFEEWNAIESGAGIMFSDFVTCDDDVATSAPMTGEQIVSSASISVDNVKEEPESEEEPDNSPSEVTPADAVDAIACLKQYFSQEADTDMSVFASLDYLDQRITERYITKNVSLQQITDYFT